MRHSIAINRIFFSISDLIPHSFSRFLQISRDEIAMLEHDLKRLKIENSGLRSSLEKAER